MRFKYNKLGPITEPPIFIISPVDLLLLSPVHATMNTVFCKLYDSNCSNVRMSNGEAGLHPQDAIEKSVCLAGRLLANSPRPPGGHRPERCPAQAFSWPWGVSNPGQTRPEVKRTCAKWEPRETIEAPTGDHHITQRSHQITQPRATMPQTTPRHKPKGERIAEPPPKESATTATTTSTPTERDARPMGKGLPKRERGHTMYNRM